MKQNGALHKVMEDEGSLSGPEILFNKLHTIKGDETPLRKDAFELNDEKK